MLQISIKPVQANLFRTLAQLGINTAAHLARNDRKYLLGCIAVALVTHFFSKYEKATTPTLVNAKYSLVDKNITQQDGLTSRQIYCMYPGQEVINQGTLLENKAIIEGQKIAQGLFDKDELETAYTKVEPFEKLGQMKYVYYNQDSRAIEEYNVEQDDPKFQPVYFRNPHLSQDFKYKKENYIHEGAQRAGKYTKEQLSGGYTQATHENGTHLVIDGTTPRERKHEDDGNVKAVYYINPNLQPGTNQYQKNHSSNLIWEGKELHWDTITLQSYKKQTIQGQLENSWSSWSKRNNHHHILQTGFTKIERFAIDHYKGLYTGSAVVALATLGSKLIIKKV